MNVIFVFACEIIKYEEEQQRELREERFMMNVILLYLLF